MTSAFRTQFRMTRTSERGLDAAKARTEAVPSRRHLTENCCVQLAREPVQLELFDFSGEDEQGPATDGHSA